MFRGSLGDLPSFLRSRNRAGLFLNRRLTWVAECFDREGAFDRYGGRGGRTVLSNVGSGQRRDILVRLVGVSSYGGVRL